MLASFSPKNKPGCIGRIYFPGSWLCVAFVRWCRFGGFEAVCDLSDTVVTDILKRG